MNAPATARPRTALVTGAGSGIGRATALRLAQDGWRVVGVDADAASLDRLTAAWPGSAPAPLALVADLTDAARIAALGDEVPPLDALVNNAGMSAGGSDALGGQDDGRAARLLALNLHAPARMVQACAPRLAPGARIVNLASGAGLRAIGWRGLYSPSKAGLIAQTRALARAHPEWTVTTLSPGFVRTELVQGLIDSGRLDPAQAVAKVPLGRMAEPGDLAEALCFLASPAARPLAGQMLVVDGGSSVCGGSAALPAALHAPLPFDAPLALQCEGLRQADWREALAPFSRAADVEAAHTPSAHASTTPYSAVLDAHALDAAPGGVLDAVLAAARRFRERHADRASLTLLLPVAPADADWMHAGDLAAARMLVATLAIEWGAHALRINALQPAPGCDPQACAPLVAWAAGARAQYLTGQWLQPGG